jgi:imidazolonepropionase-like amidohydrolase
MKNIYNIIGLILLSVGLLHAQDKGNILIKGGTVITITNGVLDNHDVYIKDGIIKNIAKDISVPKGVKVIDATDKFVMAGIVDAHSHIGISTVNEATAPNTAQVWVGDAIDPMDVGLYRALAGGVTVSHAMHGSANAIGGECETIKHRYGEIDPEMMRMVDAPRTIKFALGENPMRVHGEGSEIVPATRMGVEQVMRNSFAQAQKYKKAWADFNSGVTKKPPMYDKRMETMVDILEGEIIIHCHSYRADEILMLMNVCKDFGVSKLVFQHVNEGFKVAPELAAWGAGASVFSDWWAYKFEVYYSTAYNAAILTKNGVLTSINSDSGELIRHLYHEAAKSQKYGDLTDEEALKLITINPAKQLGIGDRVGSLEKGKEGDVVIFNNHPLSIYAIPEITVVDGVIRFDINEDPKDMRVDIDPEESIPTYMHSETHDHDKCMQGVSESTHQH